MMHSDRGSPENNNSNSLVFVEAGFTAYQYLDQNHFKLELEKIFYQNWIYACHTNQLTKKGQFFTFNIGDKNIILLRNSNNKFSAFLNVCRHRGSRLCNEERGVIKSKLLKCPYHQWAYDIDYGKLKGTTSFTEPRGFEKDNFSLIKVAVKEWRGCIFVNLSDQQSWDENTIFQRSAVGVKNYPLEKMILGKTWRKSIGCNWKLFWENFNECLHCPNIHPELTKLVPLYSRRIVNRADIPGWEANIDNNAPKFRGGLREGAETWSLDGKSHGHTIAGLTDEEINRGQLYVTSLPSMFAGFYSDHVRIVRVLPISFDETELVVEWLFEKKALDDANYDMNNVTEFACLVMQQDAKACEINQKGLFSAPPDLQTVLMPEEYLILGLHNWIRNEMREPLSS